MWSDIQDIDPDESYAAKLEYVFREYERSLDLDIAFTITPLTEAEREQLMNDATLAARVAIHDAKVRHDLITDLRNLSTNALNEGVRFNALKELGRTLYPKRFKDDSGAATAVMGRVVRYEIVEGVEH